jgi:short-subunit dehydrogenase
MDLPIKGKIVVITGVTGGIGRAIASACAKQGAIVVGIVRDLEKVKSVPELNSLSKEQLHLFQADLCEVEELRKVARLIQERLGVVHALIHNAAVHEIGSIADSQVDVFDNLISVNVRAPLVLTQSLLPLLIEGKGQVIFINSSVGWKSSAGISQYAASKHALRAIADSLREEVNRQGVKVLTS